MNFDNTDIDAKDDEYDVINMKNVTPLNDPECSHFFIEELQEEIEGYTSWTCSKCTRGKMLPKGYKVINT